MKLKGRCDRVTVFASKSGVGKPSPTSATQGRSKAHPTPLREAAYPRQLNPTEVHFLTLCFMQGFHSL